MCPSFACDCHRNKPAVPVLRRNALPNSSLRCVGLQGRASEETLPLRPRSDAVDFRPARFRRLEASYQAEKALKRVNMLKRHNESCQMMNRWGILATSSSSCHSGGAQMEAMRDTAWVLTHALVNMTNACLSSSFLRTDRAFGSRFGPVAKWPFCIQTRIRKDPQFRHFCLVAKNALFFTPFFRNQDS